MSTSSLGKAFLIAPLIAPLLYFVGALLFAQSGDANWSSAVAFGWIMSFGIPISYSATGLLGVPLYRFLDRRNMLSMANIVVGGAVLGAAVLLLFSASLTGIEGLLFREAAASIGIGATLGAAVAVAFGFIAGITRQLKSPASGLGRR